MKKSICLLLTLSVILVLVSVGMAAAKKPAPSLRCTTEYVFVGHLQEIPDDLDEEGRLLVWEGPISGDIEGVIQWWMVPSIRTGQASHYVDRFEIWKGEVLLLAGDEAGTTTARHGKNSNWRTNGTVTEVGPGFEDWLGRKEHAEGHFTWAAPGLPDEGYGTFRIN
jgi:hypothetical protein